MCQEEARGGGGVAQLCMAVVVCLWTSHSYYAGTEHIGLSPTRQTLLAPSAKRREEFGESHEG